jgi:uncharacterized membrane protein YebE (DUF533 family)
MTRDGGFGFIAHLFGRAEPAAPEPPPESEPAQGPEARAAGRGQGPALRAVLARQLLDAHLRRRHQAMEGETAHLAALDPDEAELMLRAMIAAGHADGEIDELEGARIRRALSHAPLDEATRTALEADLAYPGSLEAVLRRVEDPQTAARVYAVSVRTVRRGEATNRSYLDYLAHRLSLPADVVVRLNRRWDVPV